MMMFGSVCAGCVSKCACLASIDADSASIYAHSLVTDATAIMSLAAVRGWDRNERVHSTIVLRACYEMSGEHRYLPTQVLPEARVTEHGKDKEGKPLDLLRTDTALDGAGPLPTEIAEEEEGGAASGEGATTQVSSTDSRACPASTTYLVLTGRMGLLPEYHAE
eukprot:368612-Rhodomonas_salina.3